jgi:hypothetical protein
LEPETCQETEYEAETECAFFSLAFYLPTSIQCTQRWNAALLPGGSGQAACEREPLGGQEEREPEDEKRTEPHKLI